MSVKQPPDIEIAQQASLRPIQEIAHELGLGSDEIDMYGKSKAKITAAAMRAREGQAEGSLVLITAITPTRAGEGKTTTTVGLAQALQRLGHRAISATREPSLGPVFGVKGGAAGGGYAQVVPMEDINLHFTGDFAAVTAAHNLLSAMLDNHLHQGNALGIDARRILWRRVMDMNDRSLHKIVTGLGGRKRGVPRETGFDITPASEVMAILCLARDLQDLKERFSEILVADLGNGNYVTAADLDAHGAMAILMRDAVLPNLVQNLEGGPALIHGGPFGNIAHGCNSLIATRLSLKLADIVVTEAGFGADLGAEKFFNIKCPAGDLAPRVAVLVTTVRALKLHGGANRRGLTEEDSESLRQGLPNMEGHIENIQKFGVPVVVAINRFPTDTDTEVEEVRRFAESMGVPCSVSTVFSEGGQGGEELAGSVLKVLESGEGSFRPLYEPNAPIREKIETVACRIYGANGVDYVGRSKRDLKRLEHSQWRGLPVCMAKTQYSFSDNARLLGRPKDFRISVRGLRVSAGAGFIVAVTGDIMTMPGLPRRPFAVDMDIGPDGTITGLA